MYRHVAHGALLSIHGSHSKTTSSNHATARLFWVPPADVRDLEVMGYLDQTAEVMNDWRCGAPYKYPV